MNDIIKIANWIIKEEGMDRKFLPETKEFTPVQEATILNHLRQSLGPNLFEAAKLFICDDCARYKISKILGLSALKIKISLAKTRRLSHDEIFWSMIDNSETELLSKMADVDNRLDELRNSPDVQEWLRLGSLWDFYKKIPYPETRKFFHGTHLLDDLNLSARTYLFLRRGTDAITVEEFITISGDEFWGMNGIGEKAGQEIIDAINKLGYAFDPPRKK